MAFPQQRLRRLRRTENLRRLVRQTRLTVDDLVCPIFVCSGSGVAKEISSLPGCYHLSADKAATRAKQLASLSIPAVILFGLPASKDASGASGYDSEGVVPEAIKAIKDVTPELVVITDVCLCEYTDHGHCGVVDSNKQMDNDATLELLAKMALIHAQAGADMLAPSDMMDGRVGVIRKSLDSNGYDHLPIMSYAVKYCSAFYGPFREAADSTPQFGNRRGYQMDPPNAREALLEAKLDIEEGADVLMVKPALPYLDIISQVRAVTDVPLAAYCVSGEYAMLLAAEEKKLLDGEAAMLEMLTCIKRAGADFILTYFAEGAARSLGA
jgi:porphobilinogen synthase